MANIQSYETYSDFLSNFIVYVDARQYERICRRRMQRDRLLLRKGRPKAVYVPIAVRDPMDYRNVLQFENGRFHLPIHCPHMNKRCNPLDMGSVPMGMPVGTMAPINGMTNQMAMNAISLGNLPPTAINGMATTTPMNVPAMVNNTNLNTQAPSTHGGVVVFPSNMPTGTFMTEDRSMANFADVATLISADKGACNYSNSVTSGSTQSRTSEYSPDSQ